MAYLIVYLVITVLLCGLLMYLVGRDEEYYDYGIMEYSTTIPDKIREFIELLVLSSLWPLVILIVSIDLAVRLYVRTVF